MYDHLKHIDIFGDSLSESTDELVKKLETENIVYTAFLHDAYYIRPGANSNWHLIGCKDRGYF